MVLPSPGRRSHCWTCSAESTGNHRDRAPTTDHGQLQIVTRRAGRRHVRPCDRQSALVGWPRRCRNTRIPRPATKPAKLPWELRSVRSTSQFQARTTRAYLTAKTPLSRLGRMAQSDALRITFALVPRFPQLRCAPSRLSASLAHQKAPRAGHLSGKCSLQSRVQVRLDKRRLMCYSVNVSQGIEASDAAALLSTALRRCWNGE